MQAQREPARVDELRSDGDDVAERGAAEPQTPAVGVKILEVCAAVHHGALRGDERLPFWRAEDGAAQDEHAVDVRSGEPHGALDRHGAFHDQAGQQLDVSQVQRA